MTRRAALEAVIGGVLAPGTSHAQSEIRYPEHSRCLPDYLAALAADAYKRRNARIAAPKSADAIRKYQAWARDTFVQLAGGLPQRTDLNLRSTGSIERSGYRVEKLVYESQPGCVIAANLYLPQGTAGRLPGVLVQMGHSGNGKGYGPYQRLCQGLVLLGYAVLAFDPMGQGERTNYPKPGGWLTRLSSSDEEHSRPGRQMLLIGDTATRFQLWDAIRSLDVLAQHPRVDSGRLASAGQSGGGTLTMMLAAFDDRLAAAAVSCGNTENVATVPFFAPGSTDDAEQDLIGSGPLAFDRWDLLWPFAPKPLLVESSAHDFEGTYSNSYLASGREQFAKLAEAYTGLGARDHLQAFETPLPHSLSYPLRLAIYNWFEKHLKGNTKAIEEEPPTNPEPDETLWCGATGNVIRDFGGKSAFDITASHARAIHTPGERADLHALLSMDAPTAAPKLEVVAQTRYGTGEVLAVEVKTAENVWVPAWAYPPNGTFRRLIVLLDAAGRNGAHGEAGLGVQLAGAGIAACAADVRGIGDLRPRVSEGAPGYAIEHQSEENYAWASLIFGRSLLGQRTTDVIVLVQALAARHPQAEIIVAARDRLTIPALCAAALEPRIAKVYLSRHLVSWRSIVESEDYSVPLANFVPGVLRKTDLPQIAGSIEPRMVIVAGAVDAKGQPVPTSQSPYANYRERAGWDLASLTAL
ncbi:MAG TPA: acetylxylan esterase [Candidatus Acidoferrales bacterium]|nr:acetylxylan esterase [Candidatus Acidoferrales bacterium]